jgi:hypothetical protein
MAAKISTKNYCPYKVNIACHVKQSIIGCRRSRMGGQVSKKKTFLEMTWLKAVAYRGVFGGFKPPPRNSEVLTKLSRISSSVKNTSVTV